MPIYVTEYPCSGATFGCYVVARDRAHAGELIARRGLNEQIVGYRPKRPKGMSAREFYEAGDKLKAAHTLCFVGNILCHAGLMERSHLLDDRGLLHEMLHQMTDDIKQESYLIEPGVMRELLREFDKKARKIGF